MKMKTLILGLGNPILTDDGVGILAAREIEARLNGNEDVDVSEVSVGGLRLMESMIGYDRVILIDAIQTDGGEPGAVYRMSLEELSEISPTQHSASPHDASLTTALQAARSMGFDLPGSITVYAIEVENLWEFGEQPTQRVGEAIPRVVKAVLEEL